MSFILYYTTQCDNIQDQIYLEFCKCDPQITALDLNRATFTKACIQETYRICPTAFCLARILEEETQLSGYNLQPGVSVQFRKSLF